MLLRKARIHKFFLPPSIDKTFGPTELENWSGNQSKRKQHSARTLWALQTFKVAMCPAEDSYDYLFIIHFFMSPKFTVTLYVNIQVNEKIEVFV